MRRPVEMGEGNMYKYLSLARGRDSACIQSLLLTHVLGPIRRCMWRSGILITVHGYLEKTIANVALNLSAAAHPLETNSPSVHIIICCNEYGIKAPPIWHVLPEKQT